MAEPFLGAGMGDGGEGDGGEPLIRPLDAFGGEAELLGRLGQSEEIRPDAIGAGQIAHLLDADGKLMVKRDRRQRRRAAVALVVLSNPCVSLKRRSPLSIDGVLAIPLSPTDRLDVDRTPNCSRARKTSGQI